MRVHLRVRGREGSGCDAALIAVFAAIGAPLCDGVSRTEVSEGIVLTREAGLAARESAAVRLLPCVDAIVPRSVAASRECLVAARVTAWVALLASLNDGSSWLVAARRSRRRGGRGGGRLGVHVVCVARCGDELLLLLLLLRRCCVWLRGTSEGAAVEDLAATAVRGARLRVGSRDGRGCFARCPA